MATKIFISYAEADAEYLSELENHLSVLKRDGVLRVWHRGMVGPGAQWEAGVRQQLESAHIVVVLLSADFLASEHCWNVELQRASQRAIFGQIQLIVVLLRPCMWNAHEFARAQVLPNSGLPLTAWTHRDDAWTHIAKGILSAVHRADELAERFASQRQLFYRTATSNSGLSFLRVTLDRSDSHWTEATMASPMDPAPFGMEEGQHILLRDLYHDSEGGPGLNLDITVMNQSPTSLVLTKVGIEIIAVALMLDGHGEGVPTKVHKTDSYVLELPDVRDLLHQRYPDQHQWSHQGPLALDLVVSKFIDDPVLLPPMTPYRYGLLLSKYAGKMPNHALIRAWALTSNGGSTSSCINVVTY